MWHQIPSSTDPPWWKFDQGQEYVVQQDKPESSEWQAFAWNCPVVWCVHWCDWQHQKLASPPLHSSSWHSFDKSYTSAFSANILVLKLKCQHSSISALLLTANDFFVLTDHKIQFLLRHGGVMRSLLFICRSLLLLFICHSFLLSVCEQDYCKSNQMISGKFVLWLGLPITRTD